MRLVLIKSNLICLIISILFTSCAPNKQGMGSGMGLVAGGIIGSQFAHDKALGAVLGAGLGALIGGAIGQKMDERDKKIHADVVHKSLEVSPTGTTVAWRNPDNGHSGKVTPTKTYKEAGRDCREYTQAIEIDGEFHRAYGKACRNSDGQWEIISN